MQPAPIAHIGILVADLETSREHWSKALGGVFSPISRYRPQNWSDLGNPEPHLHDARLTFYLGDNPSIEILEFVGSGTHSPEKGEGGHHLSFPPIDDNERRRAELAELGVGIDGEIRHDDRWIFLFADARALDNVYTEWVEEHPDHPDVKDDLSPIGRLPDGTKTLFEPDTILSLDGQRPDSRIIEIGVNVDDLERAKDRWHTIIGYEFHDCDDRSAIGGTFDTAVRLTQRTGDQRAGLSYGTILEPDLNGTLQRLIASEVPVAQTSADQTGTIVSIDVDPAYLNGFGIRFQRGSTAPAICVVPLGR
jgi:catechol 2,3-dioxygenase-like lactoylglutathione lyase family enzyme